jgi:UDP-N-acetyl-D-mannosaminuronate dehydrogenase
LMKAVRAADVIIAVTNHKSYDTKAILDAAKFIFDSRNALGELGKNNPKVERL